MITTYFRSSSLNTLISCPHKFLLDYVLGFKLPGNKAADTGTTIHKALEFIARRKVCEQEGKSSFYDDDFGKEFNAANIDIPFAVKHAWELYTQIRPLRDDFNNKDLATVFRDVTFVKEWQDGRYWPMNLNILNVEYFFDIPLEGEEFSYDWEVNGERIQGQLHLVGTVDLLVDEGPSCIGIQDYKSGQRICWKTGVVKDFEVMRRDPQLRLYHYAIAKCFPQYENLLFTLFYTKEKFEKGVQNHGAYSVPFYKDDLEDTRKALLKWFNLCKTTKMPDWVANDYEKNWICRFCQFNKYKYPETNISYCNYMRQELTNIGLDRVLANRYDKEVANNYTGGGRNRTRGD